MIEIGLEISVYSLTAVVDELCRNEDMKKGREIVEEMAGSLESVLLVFDEMSKRGVEPNADTYWPLINGYSKVGEMEVAMKYVDKVMYDMLIDRFCRNGMADKAFKLRIEMERKGFYADLSLCNQMRQLLCEIYQTEKAKMLLNIMIKRGICPKMVSFTSAIN
ncbi:hypothetical protein REPUB_Repub11eG0184500 [Reevesia pubescens]